MKNYLLILLLMVSSIVYAQSTASLPILKGTNIKKGVKYTSQSGKHYLLLQQDGNLVVMTSSNQKVWGFNEVYSNFSQVSSIQLQDDGNLVARSSSNGFLWSALTANTDPGSQLIVNGSGVLQLVAPGSNILWASDGNLKSKDFIIDYGWSSYRVIDNPRIVIMGSSKVSPKAIDVVTEIYTTMVSLLKPAYPVSKLNGYRIYITNGETATELDAMSPISPEFGESGTGNKNTRDWLRGGTSSNFLWISEQMICKTGVVSRGTADNTVRTYDQVIHEFAHALDKRFGLNTAYNKIYTATEDQAFPKVERFAVAVQHWFSAPNNPLMPKEEAFLKQIFTKKMTFSCNDYNPKSALKAGESLKTGESLTSSNGKYRLIMQADGNLCVYNIEKSKSGVFTWGSYQTNAKYNLGANYSLVMQNDGNLCIVNSSNRFQWGSYQVKKYPLTAGYKLVLTDNGKLNILNAQGQVVWVN